MDVFLSAKVALLHQEQTLALLLEKNEAIFVAQSNLLKKLQINPAQGRNTAFLVDDFWSDRVLLEKPESSLYSVPLKTPSTQRQTDHIDIHHPNLYQQKAFAQRVSRVNSSERSKLTSQWSKYLPTIQTGKCPVFRLLRETEQQDTRESIHTERMSLRSCAKAIVCRMNYSRKNWPQMRSNSVKTNRAKTRAKDKFREAVLAFKDLVPKQQFVLDQLSFQLENDHFIRKIKSKSVTILTGNSILLDQNSNVQREVASLTKIMTCYLALLLIRIHDINTKELVRVSRTASSLCGTTASLLAGDMVTCEELLYGMMLPSGNDAAHTLAQQIGRVVYTRSKEFFRAKEQIKQRLKSKKFVPDEELQKRCAPNTQKCMAVFIGKMNELAGFLGLSQSQFSNSHGLADTGNKSTSRDMAVLCHYAMANPEFRNIVATKTYTCKIMNLYTKLSRQLFWENTNKLLESVDCTGIKTGVTNPAGPCMAASFVKNSHQYIVVILKTSTLSNRFLEVRLLFETAWKYKQAPQSLDQ